MANFVEQGHFEAPYGSDERGAWGAVVAMMVEAAKASGNFSTPKNETPTEHPDTAAIGHKSELTEFYEEYAASGIDFRTLGNK
jgi:hypothetical protein